MRTRRRAATALAAVVILASALSGCSWLHPDPPEATVSSVEALRVRLAAVDGISDVTTHLSPSGEGFVPDEWTAQVEATADTPDPAVAAAVRAALGDGVTQAELILSLALPAGDGAAPVRLDPRDPVVVDLVETWRRIPGVASVDVVDSARFVSLQEGVAFAEVADRLRASLGDAEGQVTLRRGTASVGVTADGPRAAVLGVVDLLAARPDVAEVYAVPGSASPRDRVVVETRDGAGVAAVLAATVDERANAGSGPRAEFTVRAPTSSFAAADPDEEITGWLGLPLGSPEPGDIPEPPEPTTPAAPPSPAAPPVLVDVGAQEAGVRAFLEAAAVTTGVPAEVTTVATQCEDGSAGTQATGSVLIPIFTVMDEPQPPFDAITRSWTEAGFVPGGSAMGRDFWKAGDGRADGVASASIRGTSEGLSLSAESVCVR
ncbi:hypothetical protein W824_08460 [Clavibacter cf. michiganensis LMG 26808]|uniref:Uncharacterized protein n=2 Tax=Clavibacter TaxID=1573 RepID=A0A399NXY3_9MICO|nr:hypothetical protein W824_08460 [Clavibacter cf. michiganensis LMG 26808]RII97446.1 hypothetical protein DZF96_07310 [Clavibacter michiganensis]